MKTLFEGISVAPTALSALEAAAGEGRLPHTAVLEGTDEANRLAAARALAGAIVCSGERPPCGVCRDCIKAKSGVHPDIIYLSKRDDKANFLINDVREIKTQAYVLPNEAEKKVYVFNEAQYLTVPCQNTLLKLIEEPPARTQFILTCPSASYLLDTVRSRSQVFFLGEAVEHSVESGTNEESLAIKLAELLCGGDEAEFMRETAVLEKNRNRLLTCLTALEICLRDAIALKFGGTEVLLDRSVAQNLSSCLTSAVLMKMIAAVSSVEKHVKSNLNINLALTRLCALLFAAKN